MQGNSLYAAASGSGGNGYVLTAGDDALILESGVRAKKLLAHMAFKMERICGVLVTHVHGDHAKYIDDWRGYAVPVYSNAEVASAYPGVVELAPKKKYRIGAFEVLPLEVPHGGVKNCAYVIRHGAIGTLLFATDLTDFPYCIAGLTHICIECNYSEELIINAMTDGQEVHCGSENHMEAGRCVSVVQRLWHPGLRTVTLLHLSDGFSDEKRFVERVKSVSGYASVTAAAAGREVDLSITDF